MQHFINETGISQSNYCKFISCSTKHFDQYTLYTYKMNLKRNQMEDTLFIENPFLVNILPRACSYLVRDGILLTKLEGCLKFTGFSNIDEDPENDDEIDGKKNDNLFDYSIIDNWNKNKELEIIMTEKANGKFSICKIYENLVICGSKNYHIVFELNKIDDALENNKNNKIMHSIICDIKCNLNNLQNLRDKFDDGYSLVGELCDGQHFVAGDNTISWFGLFKNGIPMETMDALNYLNNNGLKTVKYSKIYDANSNDNLMSVFNSARCLSGEGYVLRCRNTVTNKIILVKVKAIGYIVKRFFRQVMLKGYKYIFQITKRFIDAHDYHQLNTEASIRITYTLIKFGMWMMSKCYPVSILGHMEIKSVRGHLDNGFNLYWEQFLNETKCEDIIITENDFGEFDKDAYLSGIQLYEKRTYDNLATVIFLQGLQGSGKSTIANAVCSKLPDTIYLEQDMFWSDTLSCQGALYHNIANANGPKHIIVSRCNVNEKQYNKYLDICYELPCKVIFISPDKMTNTDLMISLQGILNRSNNGDKLMVGRHELPIDEVIKMLYDNFNNYKSHPLSHLIKTRNEDSSLDNSSVNISSIYNYVTSNIEKIKSLRLPIDNIANQIINIINNIDINKIISIPKPSYIGLLISDEDKKQLNDIVNKYVDDNKKTLYNHHITLEFKPTDTSKSVPQFTEAIVSLSKLVVRKEDNIAAYLVDSIYINDKKYEGKNNLHITAKIKNNQKPAISQSFVGLNDDTVNIINFNEIKINTTCIWFK